MSTDGLFASRYSGDEGPATGAPSEKPEK